MPFDSPDLNLGNLLTEVDDGKVQLPDFQRDWKWDADRIGSLIASISQGHPVGVVMMLEVGGEEVRFKPRAIAGASKADSVEPDRLILDGQQRLTSLYQSLRSGKPVQTYDTRGKRLERWYYVDMALALDAEADREEAIIAVPADRVVRSNFGRDIQTDYSSIEKEVEAEVFPLDQVFDTSRLFEWQNAYVNHSALGAGPATERFNHFYRAVLNNFAQYTVPVIVLNRETPKEAVCTVFEKVNTGGVPLNVFELLTATFAADDFRLNDDWATRKARLAKHPVLTDMESTDLLQAVALVVTARRRKSARERGAESLPGVSCRRKDILRLSLDEYQTSTDEVTAGFEWASEFLSQQKVFQPRDIPYRTQLVPLAALHALLGGRINGYAVHAQIERWYWCGVLGELYGGATETRFARDVEQVPPWIDGGPEPRTVADAAFETSRLFSMRTRNSAAYKGVHALLMKDGCRDWLKQVEIDMAPFFSHAIDIHHVFPRKWCDDRSIEAARRDSIVNKTPLSYDTNRTIGGRPPSAYIATVEERTQLGAEELGNLLREHKIDLAHLQSDDFNTFFSHRTEALARLIAQAMGKDVVEDHVSPSDADSEYESQVVGDDDDVDDMSYRAADDDNGRG